MHAAYYEKRMVGVCVWGSTEEHTDRNSFFRRADDDHILVSTFLRSPPMPHANQHAVPHHFNRTRYIASIIAQQPAPTAPALCLFITLLQAEAIFDLPKLRKKAVDIDRRRRINCSRRCHWLLR